MSNITLKFRNSQIILFSILCLSFFTSCNQSQKVIALKEQKLFNLNYGSFEDELTLFNLDAPGNINTYLYMNDGFFFIANGEAKKVMQFTSYGDVIGVYYNPETNPSPTFETTNSLQNTDGVQKATQQSLQYPFTQIGKIMVDTKKDWYIVDQLPQERQEQDTEHNLALRQVILRFSENGNFIDYLGQQGPGGTPFPYIRDLHTTHNNELIVVCQSTTGLIVYWFSSEGFLQYTIPLDISNLPKPSDIAPENLFVSLDNIIPDYNEHKLYIKIDYQQTAYDNSSNALAGINFVASHLYTLDVEKGTYGDPIVIPPYEQIISDGFSKLTYTIPYNFFGITESGWLFFMIADDSGFVVQMLQHNGQRLLKRHISINFQDVQYHNFCLSPDGIISALLVEQEKATVSWWRTDNLIESILK